MGQRKREMEEEKMRNEGERERMKRGRDGLTTHTLHAVLSNIQNESINLYTCMCATPGLCRSA